MSAPFGFGLFAIVHALPFQCMINNRMTGSVKIGPENENEPITTKPVAKQLFALAQEMPLSWTSLTPLGVGLGMIDHFRPFQCSASVRTVKADAVDTPASPIAKQLVLLVHDTALSATSDRPPMPGAATTDQPVPFQRSVNSPEPPFPTAKQNFLLAHETPVNSPIGGPAGLGLRTIDHCGAAPAGFAPIPATPMTRTMTIATRTNVRCVIDTDIRALQPPGTQAQTIRRCAERGNYPKRASLGERESGAVRAAVRARYPDLMRRPLKLIVALGVGAALVVPAVAIGSSASPAATAHTNVATAKVKLKRVMTGLASPVAMAWRKGDLSHIYVVEQSGTLVRISGGRRERHRAHPLGVERRRARACSVSRSRATARSCTSTTPTAVGDIHVDSYTMKGNIANPATRRQLLVIPHHQFANHNGGDLVVGPDNMLYIGVGDGGSGGRPATATGRTPTSLLGKILRINPRATGAARIPAGNPFKGKAGHRGAIWMFGLRNPWRFSFDRSTNDMWIGDVGQDKFEEIDFAQGRPEGRQLGLEPPRGQAPVQRRRPAAAARAIRSSSVRTTTGDCAIIGGYVYRGAPSVAARRRVRVRRRVHRRAPRDRAEGRAVDAERAAAPERVAAHDVRAGSERRAVRRFARRHDLHARARRDRGDRSRPRRSSSRRSAGGAATTSANSKRHRRERADRRDHRAEARAVEDHRAKPAHRPVGGRHRRDGPRPLRAAC